MFRVHCGVWSVLVWVMGAFLSCDTIQATQGARQGMRLAKASRTCRQSTEWSGVRAVEEDALFGLLALEVVHPCAP